MTAKFGLISAAVLAPSLGLPFASMHAEDAGDKPLATIQGETEGVHVDILSLKRTEARCCMNRLTAASSSRRRVSNDPNGDRHTEARHPVEGIAPDLRLSPLIAQSPSVKTPTDDRLVSRHCGFGQAAAIVARAPLPVHASTCFDRFCQQVRQHLAAASRVR
jgi:hypothetical protein